MIQMLGFSLWMKQIFQETPKKKNFRYLPSHPSEKE